MFKPSRLLIAASAAVLLAGCASQNPYDNQPPSSNKTAKYGGLGALAGAAAAFMPVPVAKSTGFWVQPCSISTSGMGVPAVAPGGTYK